MQLLLNTAPAHTAREKEVAKKGCTGSVTVRIPTSRLSHSSIVMHAQRHPVLYAADEGICRRNVLQSSCYWYCYDCIYMLKDQIAHCHSAHLWWKKLEMVRALHICNSLLPCWQGKVGNKYTYHCAGTRRSVGALSYYMWTNHLHIQEAWDGTVMMYKHGTKALVIVSAYHLCEAELSTLQKPPPLGVTHTASEMPGTPADG